jgi:hypothetical protein
MPSHGSDRLAEAARALLVELAAQGDRDPGFALSKRTHEAYDYLAEMLDAPGWVKGETSDAL